MTARPWSLTGPPNWRRRLDEASERRAAARARAPLPCPVVGYVAPAPGPVVEIEAEPETGEDAFSLAAEDAPTPKARTSSAAERPREPVAPAAQPVQPRGGGQRGQAPAVHTSLVALVAGDFHGQFHDAKALDGLCDCARDLRPDMFVFNGDTADFYAISKFNWGSLGRLEGFRLVDEIEAVNYIIDRVSRACGPQCEIHWNAGNHCDRWTRWLDQGDHAVFKDLPGMSVPEWFRFERRGVIDHGPYPEAHVELGHLHVTHGLYACQYTAAKNWREYGASTLCNHSHVPEVYYGPGFLAKQRVAVVNGHMADVDGLGLKYRNKPHRWAMGWSVVNVRRSGDFSIQQVNLWEGRFGLGGREYG